MKRGFAVLLGLWALAGCGGTFVKDPVDAGEIAPAARIGVLPINYLEKPSAEVVKNAVRFAGTAGLLATAKGKDSKRRKFSGALIQADYRYQQQVGDYLTERLAAAGLVAGPLDFRRSIDNVLGEVPPRRFEKRYPTSAGHDFLLDIYVAFVGYSAQTLTDAYLPTFHIGARLVDANSHGKVYESLIQYRPFKPKGEETTIEADGAFRFANFDELMAQIPKARDGLQGAIEAVIDRLVAEIGAASA